MQRKMLDIYEGHLAAVWQSGGCGRRGSRGGSTGIRPSWSSTQRGKGDAVGVEKRGWTCWRQEREDRLDTGRG